MRKGATAARKAAALTLGAAMFSLLFGFGREAERLMEGDPLASSDPARALRCALLALPALLALLFVLLEGGERLTARRHAKPCRPFSARRAFGFLLLCYLPMFAIAFPGVFAYDAPFQLRQAFTGAYSTHHPLVHTLLLGGCVALGRLLGSAQAGAALYTAAQTLLLAALFALTCASIARQSGARAARRSAVFFGLYPMHMLLAVNATKDALFGGLFALTLALLREASRKPRLSQREAARLIACACLMAMMRNNAVYALAAWALLAAVPAARRRRGACVAAAALAVALSLCANGLLARVTDAAPGDLSETLSWPLQQLARARLTQGERLTDAEKETIDRLMPGEAWRLYDPTISDPVKFEFDTAALLDDPRSAARVYLSVGQKCPHAYADALLLHTYSFLYPYREYRVSGPYLQLTMGEDYYDDWCDFERMHSAFPGLLSALAWRVGARGAAQFPAVGWLFNMGLIVWAMLFLLLRDAYAGRWRRLGVGGLAPLLLGTYLLGPVMAGRYIYPFVCALPALASRDREE